MSQRNSFRGRKHQIVLSLTPCGLGLLHLQRGWLGWHHAHSETFELPVGEASLQQVALHLRRCVTAWEIPAGTRIFWVLAADILGVIAVAGGTVPAASILPFAPADMRTQPDQFAANQNPSLLWIHKDWLAEIERISEQAGLALTEIFARAQVFQQLIKRLKGALKVVLDARGSEYFLHIYADNGMILRSTVLSRLGDDAYAQVRAELAALGTSVSGEGEAPVPVLAPETLLAEVGRWPGFACQAQLPVAPMDLLGRFWRSDIEGIVVRPSHEDLIKQIQWFSVGLGAVGLVLLSLMFWHDNQLQQLIESNAEQVRKERPAVEAAKALKLLTLDMADAVQAAQVLRENVGAVAGLAQVVNQFPPPPARLLYVRSDEKTLAFVGSGNDASVAGLRDKGISGYAALTDFPVPESLREAAPVIHLQTTRLPASPVPESSGEAAPAASSDSSK